MPPIRWRQKCTSASFWRQSLAPLVGLAWPGMPGTLSHTTSTEGEFPSSMVLAAVSGALLVIALGCSSTTS